MKRKYDKIIVILINILLIVTSTIVVAEFDLLISTEVHSEIKSPILIIDDDNDIHYDDDYSIERFETVIDGMGYTTTTETPSETNNATWHNYDFIVWSCGDDLTPIYDPEYKQMLIDYVADGGHLILESGHIAAWIDKYGTQTVDQNLRINVLHATTDFVYCDVGDMTFKNTHPIAETPNILPATIGFTATYPGDYSGDADAVRCLDDAVGVYGWSDVRWSGSSVASWVIEACNSIIAYDDDDNINNGGQIVFLTIDIDDIDNIELQNQLIENAVTWITTDTENQYPIANFTYIPPNPTTDNIIYFTDTSTDTDGIIVNWTWDFADGNISYEINPIHQYSIAGNYTVCLNVTDNDGAFDEICKQITVSEAIEQIDVNQSVFDRGFPIRHAVDGDWAGAQNFTPTVNMITKVEIYLRMFGSPEFDLTVELREDSPNGTLLDTVVFTTSEVPSSWDWLEVDFTDTVVTPGTDYFIVCPPAPSGVTTSFGYEWGYAFGNQYDDGSFWFTRDGGALWRDLPTMYEFVFRTYGY